MNNSGCNRAANSTATAFGVMIGVAGIEHGLFEVLQGNVRPAGLLCEAIGPAQRFWEYGTEPALMIVPSTLISGILAGATATAIHGPLGVWRRILLAPLRRLLYTLWPGTLAAMVVTFVVAVEIAIFGYPLLWLFDADTALDILNILYCAMVGLMLLSVLSAIALDVKARVAAEKQRP